MVVTHQVSPIKCKPLICTSADAAFGLVTVKLVVPSGIGHVPLAEDDQTAGMLGVNEIVFDPNVIVTGPVDWVNVETMYKDWSGWL